MPAKVSNPATSAKMVNPSKPASIQDDCPLFKLAAETRNKIYELVYAIETNEDGSVELNETLASNALTGTCQQIYNESRKIHEFAYRDLPTYTFTANVLQRDKQRVFHPDLSNNFYRRMTSFRVNWRADERNHGKPLRFTSHFDKVSPPPSNWNVISQPSGWDVRVELHDSRDEAIIASHEIVHKFRRCGLSALKQFHTTCSWPAGWVRDNRLRDAFACLVYMTVYPGPWRESRIWDNSMRRKKQAIRD
jgi:hypothetical protein